MQLSRNVVHMTSYITLLDMTGLNNDASRFASTLLVKTIGERNRKTLTKKKQQTNKQDQFHCVCVCVCARALHSTTAGVVNSPL